MPVSLIDQQQPPAIVQPAQKPPDIVIAVDKEGRTYWNGELVSDEELRRRLDAMKQTHKNDTEKK